MTDDSRPDRAPDSAVDAAPDRGDGLAQLGLPVTRREARRAEAAAPAGGRRPRRRPRRGATVLLALVAALVVVVTVVAAGATLYVGGLARTWSDGVGTVEPSFRPDAERPADPEPEAVDVLLVGTDTRAQGEDLDVEDASGSSGRSDTLMLVHVPADRRDVSVTSLMRDLWVTVPGHGEAKLNAAMAWGGVPLTVATVEDLTGVRVDHVAVVDFDGFRAITDALGGVDVENPTAFSSRGHDFRAGTNHLSGDAALVFVRARYPFADGDHTRVRNQQEFLRAVAQQLASRRTLTDPARLRDVVAALAPAVSVDPGFDLPTVTRLGYSLRAVPVSAVRFETLPTAGTATRGDQSVVLVDPAGVEAWRQALLAD